MQMAEAQHIGCSMSTALLCRSYRAAAAAAAKTTTDDDGIVAAHNAMYGCVNATAAVTAEVINECDSAES